MFQKSKILLRNNMQRIELHTQNVSSHDIYNIVRRDMDAFICMKC